MDLQIWAKLKPLCRGARSVRAGELKIPQSSNNLKDLIKRIVVLV